MAPSCLNDNEIFASKVQVDSDGRGVIVDQKVLYMDDVGKVDAHAKFCPSDHGSLHPPDARPRDLKDCCDPNDSCDNPINKTALLCGYCRGLPPNNPSVKYQVASDSEFQRQWRQACIVHSCSCLAVLARKVKIAEAGMISTPTVADRRGPFGVREDAAPRADGGQLSSATYTVAILHEYSATHVKEHLVVFPVDASGNPQTTNVPLEIFSYESKTSKGHRKEDQRDYIKIRDSTGQWHRMSVGSRDRAAEVWLAQNIIE